MGLLGIPVSCSPLLQNNNLPAKVWTSGIRPWCPQQRLTVVPGLWKQHIQTDSNANKIATEDKAAETRTQTSSHRFSSCRYSNPKKFTQIFELPVLEPKEVPTNFRVATSTEDRRTDRCHGNSADCCHNHANRGERYRPPDRHTHHTPV